MSLNNMDKVLLNDSTDVCRKCEILCALTKVITGVLGWVACRVTEVHVYFGKLSLFDSNIKKFGFIGVQRESIM